MRSSSGSAGVPAGPLPALSVRDLRHRWPRAGHDVLDIPTLEVLPGQAVFLHGPSGCGKSTLLGLLAGVLLPAAGRVEVLGRDWAGLRPAERDRHRADHLGVVFQQFNLLPYLGTLDNVLLPCRFSARRRQQARRDHGSEAEAAAHLLMRMDLPASLATRRAAELSVGQQQRVAAARALIGSPEIVIADEPTSALDAALRDRFMELLLSSTREAGCTLVFVSHDERLAAHFDRCESLPGLNRAGAPA